jgi:hypothetical protein
MRATECAARALLEAILAEHLPSSLRANALVLLAEISFNDDNVAETVGLLTEARKYADEPWLAAMVQLGLSWFQPAVGDFSGGVIHAEQALFSPSSASGSSTGACSSNLWRAIP